MAEIIEQKPEDNLRLGEIYEILLVAGYFRIRISSLKAFDKVVGGIAWCITSSNFEIDVEYNDEMQIGQKIKVSEMICDSLAKMKCPYSLQPFQLQGLDVNNIFPIVQWLVKFVYETRFERQKYDRELSMILGSRVTRLYNIGNRAKIPQQEIERSRVNQVIRKSNIRNPVRVYSALLEFNDASATKMYNKLLNLMGRGKEKSKEQQSHREALVQMLEDQNQEESTTQDQNQFGQFSHRTVSQNVIQKYIMENKNSIQLGILERDINQEIEQQPNLKAPANSKNESNNSLKEKETAAVEQQKIAKQLKNDNIKYMKKMEILRNQLSSYQTMSGQLDNELNGIQRQHSEVQESANKEIERNQEYVEMEQEIVTQLQANKTKVSSKLQKLVERRVALRNKKAEVKKRAKAKIEELSYELQLAQASVPQIDEEAFKLMLKEAEMKKQIYDKKYEQLTHINQELAVLQRKAENYTSPPEIAQYHQRFIELFEAINVLIEQKRSMFSEISNLESLKKVVANYLEILSNMKVGYNGVKKKAELKQFIEDIKEILQGLDANMKNSESTLAKIKGRRQSVYGEYMDLIRLERDYLHLLRILKIEYENAARYYK